MPSKETATTQSSHDTKGEASLLESPAAGDRTTAAPAASAREPVRESRDIHAIEVEIGPMGIDEQIQVLNARWAALDSQIDRLMRRIDGLEGRLPDAPFGRDGASPKQDALPTDTPDQQHFALVSAGVPAKVADDLVWRQSQLEIERLELRDQAVREGWFRTDRYFDELKMLNGASIDLKTEVGYAAYDRYLYETGEFNRVRIESVIPGSVAEASGLLPGDVVESYDGRRIFDFTELRNATTDGARDEPVPVIVRRDGSVIATTLARGPIGVRLTPAAVPPGDG